MTQEDGVELHSDTPLDNPSDDELGYEEFSMNLAETIERRSPSESFVIGIYGEWGSGKSTVLNFVEQYLNESEKPPILIRFNPWWFSGQEDLIQRFFNELESGFGDRKDNTGGAVDVQGVREKFSDYSLMMSKLPLSKVTGLPIEQVLESAGELAEIPDKTLQEMKTDISETLESLDRRVVIMLDDIDRLTDEEIRQMFRLVKSVANFPNVTYVLAFDQEVVVESLSEVQGIGGEEYLDKIIQLPKHLPIPEEEALDSLFEERLEEIRGIEDCATLLDEPDINEDRLVSIYQDGVSPAIGTPRDVVRLSNSIETTYSGLEEDINFIDLIGIEAIRVFNRNLYEEIRDDPDRFVLGGTTNLAEAFKRRYSDDDDEYYADLMSGEQEIGELSESEKVLLKKLFPKVSKKVDGTLSWKSDENWDTARKRHRIGHSDSFSRYFRQTVPVGKATEREIEMLLDVDQGNEFAEILKEMSEEDTSEKVGDLIKRLTDYTEEIEGNNQAVLDGVFLVGDRLIRQDNTESSLQYSISNYLREIVEEAIDDPIEETVSNLSESIRKGNSVYLPVAIVRRWLRVGIDSEEEEAMRELRDVIVNKIEDSAEKGELRNVPNLGRVLVVWGEWSDSETLDDWSDEVTQEDSGLLEFVGYFEDNYEFGQYINLDYLNNFVDVSSVEERIEQMNDDELSDDERKTREVFLDTMELKEENEYPDRAYADYSIENWIDEE
jgi:predicted KAP-like P-loop ATPase